VRNKSSSSLVGVDSWNLGDLGSFYISNKSQFVSHAMRRLGDSLRAEEVVHEALLKVMLAAPELNSDVHAKAYVHRTIDNLCMDIFRWEGRRPPLIVLDDATTEIEKSSLALNVDLSEALSRAEDAAIVRQAISLLSPAERAALVMWEVDGRSAEEISRELGIKESSVRHTVSRARASLRRILSKWVIDEARGLTGLDMLSTSYGRAKVIVKKSSKAALSLILVLFAFAGFNSLSVNDVPSVTDTRESISTNEETIAAVKVVSEEVRVSAPVPSKPKLQLQKEKLNRDALKFPGLSKAGIPTGFTIADSTGAVGPAYFRDRGISSPISYMSSSQIIKTGEIAANIFISQKILFDEEGFIYTPTVSFGRAGQWVPLLVSVSKSEIELIEGGNYLVTAYIAVDSAIESPIRITAKANGRDLDTAPDRVITRLVLDPSKSTVLSQAVYVIEIETRA